MNMIKERKRPLKRIAIAILGLVLLFFLMDFLFPVNTNIEYSPVIEARDGSVLHSYLTHDQQWRMNTRLDEITPELRKAIIYKEDKHFYHHPGIDPLAIARAIGRNLFHKKRTSGASTITMQVARMLEPKSRTYVNKVIEMFRALQLEVHHNKDQILQLYLNLVPYGSNIQGVKAASILYLDKSPGQLSLAELTALSIIPNRPNSLVIGRDNHYIVKERNKWLYRFQKDKIFSPDIIDDALAEPLTAYRHFAPSDVPQFANRLRKHYPQGVEIRTAIDKTVQAKAQDIASNYMAALRLHHINNAAVLIVDNKTHEVCTYIGSADFKDKLNHGQVDGISAVRSPGSTLKPLLYGLSFDKGYITPRTIIADVPVNFNGYMPENYDMAFRGNVTAEEALRLSLNIPAVKLLDHMGTETFVHILGDAGFRSIAPKKRKAGLSMILGGCGVKLEELVELYSSFANNGNHYPLIWTKDDSLARTGSKGNTILSTQASYMLTSILAELHRPDLPNLADQASGVPNIAWKTGTSYGRKDAWSIGYNKRYTIGVWIGNFSGQGVSDLSGAATATPLLFELFSAIDRGSRNEWITAPDGVGFRLVCAKSGKLPNDYCEDQVMDSYIPGVSANERCEHLKKVWLSADGKCSYCTSCLPASGYITRMVPNIPADLAAYYNMNHTDYEKVPAHNPACTRILDGLPPVINSLTNGMTYLIMDKGKQQLQLSCTTENDVHTVYWYVNNKYYANTKVNDKTFFIPTTPKLKISCTDDKGRNANIEINIKFL